MRAAHLLGSARWRQDLRGRSRDFCYFYIPGANVEASSVARRTESMLDIILSFGVRLRGYYTISSGTELLIPEALRSLLEQAQGFEAEIIGRETGEKVTLRIEPA